MKWFSSSSLVLSSRSFIWNGNFSHSTSLLLWKASLTSSSSIFERSGAGGFTNRTIPPLATCLLRYFYCLRAAGSFSLSESVNKRALLHVNVAATGLELRQVPNAIARKSKRTLAS